MADQPRLALDVTEDELTILNGALNEVCNGVHIDDPEFATRVGGTREEASALLRRVHTLLMESLDRPR